MHRCPIGMTRYSCNYQIDLTGRTSERRRFLNQTKARHLLLDPSFDKEQAEEIPFSVRTDLAKMDRWMGTFRGSNYYITGTRVGARSSLPCAAGEPMANIRSTIPENGDDFILFNLDSINFDSIRCIDWDRHCDQSRSHRQADQTQKGGGMLTERWRRHTHLEIWQAMMR